MVTMPGWIPEPVGIVVGGLALILVVALAAFVIGRAFVYLWWFLSWLKFHLGWMRLNDEAHRRAYTYWDSYGAMEKRKK